MSALVLAALGGGLGAALRLGLTWAALWGWGEAFLVATLIANLGGSALIGALSVRDLSANARAFWMTGFCGGLTTFSALALEVMVLGLRGDWVLGLGYLGGSVLGAIAAVAVARRL
ncbi:MAG: fluoride efflux transporter FluC [Roseinatronobacter sp.]